MHVGILDYPLHIFYFLLVVPLEPLESFDVTHVERYGLTGTYEARRAKQERKTGQMVMIWKRKLLERAYHLATLKYWGPATHRFPGIRNITCKLGVDAYRWT
uniref:uncharacterized protein LOC122605697 n=1 Tax=Erigeron canadensis TaxID=72917 RepID=UPI001CB8B94C|nr:uncharacterized protein LOC122605697 [Erigeron canadensis]